MGVDTIGRDLINACGEFRHVKETNSYTVENDIVFLPIASKECSMLYFSQRDSEKKMELPQSEEDTFFYYRVRKGVRIRSDRSFFVGKEIPIKHDPKRKRLVMSIFVDGLAQQLLTKDNFEKLMPNTYRFFAEQGMVCTNAWTTGEWSLD